MAGGLTANLSAAIFMKNLRLFLSQSALGLAVVLVTALGTGCIVLGKQKSNPTLFNGTDLSGWEITDFAGGGAVTVKDGEIHFAQGELITGIHLAHDNVPRTNYELEVEAMKIDGDDFFCAITFPVGETYATFVPGGWGGTVVGISSIDGMDAAENETATFMKFEKNQWYRFKVRVTGEKIQCFLDGKIVVDLPLEDRRIALRPGPIELSVPIGLASFQCISKARNVKLRPINP